MYNPLPDLIKVVALLIAIIGPIVFINGAKKKLQEGQIFQEPLLKNEKLKVWIFALLNPIVAGAILYFGLRKRFPAKAKNSNTISFTAFGIWIIVWVLLSVLS